MFNYFKKKMNKKLLLQQFIKNPINIGSILPSSKSLCFEMMKDINIENAENIVELGAGTGAFTNSIQAIRNPYSKFIAIELYEKFCNVLSEKFPDTNIVNGNAEELSSICRKNNMSNLDIIISGLPWANFSEKIQYKILSEIDKMLKETGCFVTFSYIQSWILPAELRFRKLIKKLFEKIEYSKIIWKNFPPAYVIRCYKTK